MLILIRKIIKILNYIKNESAIALLDVKLINTTGLIYHCLCGLGDFPSVAWGIRILPTFALVRIVRGN